MVSGRQTVRFAKRNLLNFVLLATVLCELFRVPADLQQPEYLQRRQVSSIKLLPSFHACSDLRYQWVYDD